MVKAALIQMKVYDTTREAVEVAKKYTKEASSGGASIVCLPELFNVKPFCSESNVENFKLAELIPSGFTTSEMAKTAREEGIVVVGGIFEEERKGLYYNTVVILGPDGELIGKYRKSHIHEMPGLWEEKFYFHAGNTGFQVFPTPFGVKIGVAICYDRDFPEAFSVLGLKGADLVFVPTLTCDFARPRWETTLRAHALFNRYYVGGASPVGTELAGDKVLKLQGASVFIDPIGQIMAQAGTEEEEIVYADIDMEGLARSRMEWFHLRDRRPDLYSLVSEP